MDIVFISFCLMVYETFLQWAFRDKRDCFDYKAHGKFYIYEIES